MRAARRTFRVFALFAALVTSAAPASAHVDVSFDRTTMQDLLTALAPDTVIATLAGREVEVRLSDLKVTAFRPSASEREPGYVETSMRVRVPSLGISTAVRPHVHLDVVDLENGRGCRISFRNVDLKLPLLGAVDLGPLLPTIDLPAEHFAGLETTAGEARVRTTLAEVTVGARMLRLRFDVGVMTGTPPEP